MRKKLLLFLLLTGSARVLFGQANVNYFFGSFYPGGNPGKSEQLFGYPAPGKTKVNFYFHELKNSGSFLLELNNIRQFNNLPNLDSVLAIVKTNLRSLGDSLKDDGINRRVDYVASATSPQIRVINYSNAPKQYVITRGELNELKTDQDTLRIKVFAPVDDSLGFAAKNKRFPWRINSQPFFITLIINNISDINSLDDNILQTCITKLRQEITVDFVEHADQSATYNAHTYMKSNKTIPMKAKWTRNISSGSYTEFVPNMYAGIGFVRGNLLPSLSVGLRYTKDDGLFSRRQFYAMYEPHYVFTHDAANKLITDRNDFITFRYINISKRRKEPFDFVDNVALGYLVTRTGNWFEPNTWKLGLPGVRSGWLQLETELYFNGFFKNLSPSLRLTLHYE